MRDPRKQIIFTIYWINLHQKIKLTNPTRINPSNDGLLLIHLRTNFFFFSYNFFTGSNLLTIIVISHSIMTVFLA